jgi:hypothetical protein
VVRAITSFTHEKDIKIGQGEPGEEKIKGVVEALDKQTALANEAVVGPQHLANVDE